MSNTSSSMTASYDRKPSADATAEELIDTIQKKKPPTDWFNARTCYAEESCKAPEEPFPYTLQCPLCDGYVHFQCSVFNMTDHIGKPVCAKCAPVLCIEVEQEGNGVARKNSP